LKALGSVRLGIVRFRVKYNLELYNLKLHILFFIPFQDELEDANCTLQSDNASVGLIYPRSANSALSYMYLT